MKKLRICLSIAATDEAFAEMIKKLSDYAEVITVGLDDYSLEGVDIFIGKVVNRIENTRNDCSYTCLYFRYKSLCRNRFRYPERALFNKSIYRKKSRFGKC